VSNPLCVIVTAAGQGIGRAIAQAFLARGAHTHACDVDEERLRGALESNPGLRGTRVDVAIPADVERLFAEALGWMGRLDVLVNNAGIAGPRAALEDIDYDDWDRTIAVNLSGMFYCIKQAASVMKRQLSGCIINVSTASVRTAIPLRAPYVASKAGVMGLTQTVARELGPFNVRCNAILPGLMDNPRGRGIIQALAAEQGIAPSEMEQEFLRYISMRTWIDPAEVGEMAVFLASDAARHVTNQYIAVDGNVEWET
jgi:NAD(P)-dependent dehydrogenase (short-subunit alcohol dehydrogenase family)